MAKKTNIYFPYKSYLYLILGVVFFLLLMWYITSWIKVRNDERLATSYLLKTNTITYHIDDLKEVSSVLQESPNDYFIYISYAGDEDIYKLEKRLKRVIDDYNLKDEFYYLDITSFKDDENIFDKLNQTFNTSIITSIPCIIYFKSGVIEDIIVDNKKVFDYNSFVNLLKDNTYEKAS